MNAREIYPGEVWWRISPVIRGRSGREFVNWGIERVIPGPTLGGPLSSITAEEADAVRDRLHADRVAAVAEGLAS